MITGVSLKHLTYAVAKRLAVACLVAAVSCTAGAAAPTPAPHSAPAASQDTASIPAKIDLDAFDAMKKTVQLPDGETLAYISMGDPKGTPVVLIHGYTDNARDWVPLVPYL
jgi:hypothetical protein